MSIIDDLATAKEFQARIQKCKNDVHWITHYTRVKQEILDSKIKWLNELKKDIPKLEKDLAEKAKWLDAATTFLAQNQGNVAVAEEIAEIVKQLEKVKAEADKLRADLARLKSAANNV